MEASSGDRRRHRLSRAGNRRITRVLHVMAIVQLCHDTAGRAYYRRRARACPSAAGRIAAEADADGFWQWRSSSSGCPRKSSQLPGACQDHPRSAFVVRRNSLRTCVRTDDRSAASQDVGLASVRL
ncbi:transposase [Amycolatopsis sp. CA-126428]|uniref:transposase n=1 Tax=Amycolatopsis sp. CA-126428 TaxID=2073158 RepID=UPI0018ED465D